MIMASKIRRYPIRFKEREKPIDKLGSWTVLADAVNRIVTGNDDVVRNALAECVFYPCILLICLEGFLRSKEFTALKLQTSE